eukprot:TRINITY_DN866_c3_g1_i1.p2 TRINITY_DN866_c3_g1~~TRINITY_DN866_c3_g1_i1.p2  ORF type:complete len:116 (-),score=11.19 TRINITY_DN866_c3_g1_i1:16-363(-)
MLPSGRRVPAANSGLSRLTNERRHEDAEGHPITVTSTNSSNNTSNSNSSNSLRNTRSTSNQLGSVGVGRAAGARHGDISRSLTGTHFEGESTPLSSRYGRGTYSPRGPLQSTYGG